MFRRCSRSTFFCIVAGLLFVACDIEAPSLDPSEEQCSADEEGNTRGRDGAVCKDGLWLPASDSDASQNDSDASPNACGGTTQLANQPGDACGVCELDTYVCDGTDKTVCDDAVGCPTSYIVMKTTTGIEGDKAILNAVITAVDDANPPTDHGFCWAVKDESGTKVDEKCKELGALTKADEGKEIQLDIEKLWPGHKHFAQAYVVTADKADEKQRSRDEAFISFAPAPARFEASDDQSAHVVLSWAPAEGARGYKVFRDEVHLVELDDDLNGSDQITINDKSAVGATLSFAQSSNPTASNNLSDYVLLNSGNPELATQPKAHFYSVTAVYQDAESEPSNVANGSLITGGFTYQWMYSDSGEAGSFQKLAGATTLRYEDASAPINGALRHYYLEVSAEGATSIMSPTVSGRRSTLVAPTQVVASNNQAHGVIISWKPVAGADSYSVFRSDKQAALQTGIVGNEYLDTTATAPDLAAKSPSFTASKNQVLQVQLTWTDVGHAVGPPHQYWVVAHQTASASTSAPSATVTGNRYYTLLRYEVITDNTPDVISLYGCAGTGNPCKYNDTDAPAPFIEPGAIRAITISPSNNIILEIYDPPKHHNGTNVVYRLLAVFQSGIDASVTMSATSTTAQTGYRELQAPTRQWQTAQSGGGYSPAPTPNDGATYPVSPVSEKQKYRLQFAADNVTPVYSEAIIAP